MSDAYTDDDNAMQATAVGLLNTWPDLRTQLVDVYTKRVADLPFVPLGWIDAALAHLHEPSGAVWVPQPRPLNPPPWLRDDPQALDAWRQVFDAVEAAVVLYARGQAEAGAIEMASLQARATFWSGLYTVVKAVADAPGTVLAAAGDVADNVVRGVFSSSVGKVLLIGGIIAIGAAVYFLAPNLKALGARKLAAI